MSPCDQIRTLPEMARCGCGHPLVVHTLNDKKQRKACTHMDGERGQCPCKQPH